MKQRGSREPEKRFDVTSRQRGSGKEINREIKGIIKMERMSLERGSPGPFSYNWR